MSIYIIYKVRYLLYNYYGDNMSKKGFTLIELLAVIALLAIIVVIAVPNLLKVFTTNKDALSRIQKQQIKSATEMYLNDYCTEPIDDSYNCPSTITMVIDNTTGIIKVTSGTVQLTDLNNYFDDNTITRNCEGYVSIGSGNIDLSNISCNFNN